jgi:hypothetical protein
MAGSILAFALITATALQTNQVGLAFASGRQARLLRNESCILRYRQASPTCLGYFDDLTIPAERPIFLHGLEIIERKHLSVFFDPHAVHSSRAHMRVRFTAA